jgi:hypothetical protein
MKKLLTILFMFAFIGVHAQNEMNLKQTVAQLQDYLDGVEENAKIAISDEGVVTYTKKFGDNENDYRAVFRLSNVNVSLEERKDENYLEGEPKYYMKFSCETKGDPCIIYTKLSDESSTNSYKFTNFPVWTVENGKDAVKIFNKIKEQL